MSVCAGHGGTSVQIAAKTIILVRAVVVWIRKFIWRETVDRYGVIAIKGHGLSIENREFITNRVIIAWSKLYVGGNRRYARRRKYIYCV